MAAYKYVAYDSHGAKVFGVINAETKQLAINELESKKLYPIELQLEQKNLPLFQSNSVSIADVEFLTSELSLLLDSGIKIDKGLDIIRKSKAKPALANIINDISKKIKGGISLSSACSSHPKIFDGLYCNLIELGEASGNLSEIFADLAKDLKFKRDLRNKIVSSLTYPLVILFVCILSVLFIFNFIIPRMAVMFNGAKDLPWYTELMLNISEWMINYQSWLGLMVIFLVITFRLLLKKQSVIEGVHKAGLRLPIFSTLIITIERIRFNSGLAMMIKSGVAIDKAIKLATGNVKNQTLKQELDIAQKKIKNGANLSASLQQTRIYPPFFVSLLEVGEESGNLEKVFNEIASRSRQEFELWTQKVTTLIEPLMILIMGGLVGGVVVIMLLSMVSMNDIGI